MTEDAEPWTKGTPMTACDHKFVDSKLCLKCGWSPGESQQGKARRCEHWGADSFRIDRATGEEWCSECEDHPPGAFVRTTNEDLANARDARLPEPPPISAPHNAFWDYYRAQLTPCPCGGKLVFTGAQLRATCWAYCAGKGPSVEGGVWVGGECPLGHGFEPNHPIAYWDCAENAVPEAVRLWNAYLAAKGWETPEVDFSERAPDDPAH